MSAIASASSNSLVQLLQQAQQANQSKNQSGTFPTQFKSAFEKAAQAAGVDASKLPDLENQIQAAVQKAQSSGSDPKTAVRDAVDGVLKQNGVDSTKFRAAMQANRPHRHHGSHGAKQSQSTDDNTPTAKAAAMLTGTGTLLDTTA